MSFIKLCFLIRIFVKLSFLVKMLMSVARDLQLFILFFLIVVGAFTVMIHVLVEKLDQTDGYEGGQITYFILALR